MQFCSKIFNFHWKGFVLWVLIKFWLMLALSLKLNFIVLIHFVFVRNHKTLAWDHSACNDSLFIQHCQVVITSTAIHLINYNWSIDLNTRLLMIWCCKLVNVLQISVPWTFLEISCQLSFLDASQLEQRRSYFRSLLGQLGVGEVRPNRRMAGKFKQ